MAENTFNILSLCSGIGGLDIGVKRALPNARTVCCVEREAFCATVLVEKMRNGQLDDAPIWADLATFDGKPWRGIVDCIVAGFPCQPWSVAGKRKGTEDERWLWPDIARIVRDVRPEFVFLENVPGLLMGGMGHVLGNLAEMGFDAEWGVFSAEEVGAPHKRERVFILAQLADSGGLGYGGRDTETRPASANKTTGSGCKLGNTHNNHVEARPRKQTICSPLRSAKSDQELANTNIARCGSRSGDREGGCLSDNLDRDAEEDKPQGSRWECGAGKVGQNMAHSGGEGYQGSELGEAFGERNRAEASGSTSEFCLPRFPPRPDDLQSWSEIIANNPSLEPAICRVANGLPDWVDRIRALGNAVVPGQAALAFKQLFYRINECDK